MENWWKEKIKRPEGISGVDLFDTEEERTAYLKGVDDAGLAYDDGYSNGHDEGSREGYDDGHYDGQEEGFDEGYQKGFNEGQTREN